jgi:hypothetical protein
MAQILGEVPKKGPADELSDDLARHTADKEIEYTPAQREEFIGHIENYMLDAKVSEKALRVELSEAGIETEEEFSITEQPTAVLAEVAAYCVTKAKAMT